MAWIESHEELLIHPKTLDLMNRMKWDTNFTLGTLHRFWWWCMRFAQDGDLRRHNASRLAAAVGLPDTQAEKFVEAMVQAGWLDTTPYFRVHDWWQYTGLFLQRKHSRNPHIWRQIRDSYLTPSTTSTIELDESCNAPDKMHPDPCSTTPSAQPASCSILPAVQQEECCSPPTVHLDSCSCTPPNLTIPNLTIPDITKQKKQQQQQPADFQTYQHSENPGRHQQQPSPIPPLVAGAVADAVGLGDCLYRPPIQASPDNDLKRILYDRIGRKVRLSLLDLNKIINLKNKHGPDFFSACDFLHGGVTNPAAFLLAILEPEAATEKLAERLRQRALAQDTNSQQHPDQEHD
jgi:hypothetical protein